MSLAIDGLVSGLDTTTLIDSLMSIESGQQTLLKNKVSTSKTFISALQALNTKVAALAELATSTAKPAALDLYSTTSSSTTVTATAATGATAGEIEFVVDQVAQSQKLVTGAMTEWPDATPVITIVDSEGTATEISAASASLDDVVTAINDAGIGVSALRVAAGTDPGTGEALYRIQLTATESGAAGAFTIYRGTSADVTAGTATDVLSETGAALIRSGQDAEVTLWAGTAAAQTITSASNTFTDLLPGVSVTVSAASTDPVTVTVARDDEKISTLASDLVTALNGVFALIATNSSVSTSRDSTGTATTTGGVFTGDSTVREVNRAVLSAASLPVNGRSPSELGISITKSGTIEFDAEKFAAALADDPAFVETALQEIASRVAAAAGTASDKYDGQLTSKITGQQSVVKDLGTQIDNWDRRLESRRATLERTYAALEVQLSALNSQSSWLSSQLDSLSSSSDS